MLSDFDLDILEKKKVARGARYKKCGSKSKLCTLSTDRLTQKQIAAKGGPVVSINLNRPMSWETFKSLSKDTQFEYIYQLMDKYNVTANKLGEMFGVRGWAITLYFREQGIPITFSRGARMNETQTAAWEAFLNGEAPAVPVAADVAPQRISLEDIPSAPVVPTVSQSAMGMRSFTIQFDGELDVNQIYNSIKCLLGESAFGECVINCSLAKQA